MLTSKNLKLEDWAEILKEYDIQNYINTDTMLELAVPLKWDFDVPMFWKILEEDGVVEIPVISELIDAADETNEEMKSRILEIARKMDELNVRVVLSGRKGD